MKNVNNDKNTSMKDCYELYTFTIEERSKIEVTLLEGYKPSIIANTAKRHRQNKGRKLKYTSDLIDDIKKKLEETWSPELISGSDIKG